MSLDLKKVAEAGQRALACEDWDEGERLWRLILQHRPEHHHSRYNLARCCWQQRKIDESLAQLQQIPADFEYYGAVLNLEAILCTRMGEHHRAIACYRAAIERLPDDGQLASNYLLSLHYPSGGDRLSIAEEHRKFASHWDRHGSATECCIAEDPGALQSRKLRIAFLSADFRLHSVSYFFEPVMAALSRDAFEWILYSLVRKPDAMTELLRERVDRFRDIAYASFDEAADIIRADRPDVLVDLGGHTENNGLRLMGMNLAPIQVSWLGYPHSTGLQTIAYRFSDARIEPLPEFQTYSSETIVHLPDGCHCYRMPGSNRDIGPLPMNERGFPTFICCNDAAKLSVLCLQTWADLLAALPNSRLLLKNASCATPGFREKLFAIFETAGVQRTRLDLRTLTSDFNDHLATYDEADIALDSFPYNGTTTTCEAFWCGLPVLTLAGDTAASRHGLSRLGQLALNDWIASTPEDYVKKARTHCENREHLERLRRSMRSRLLRSSLGDPAWMARRLEYAIINLWVRLHAECLDKPRVEALTGAAHAHLEKGRGAHHFREGTICVRDGAMEEAVVAFEKAARSGTCPEGWVALGRIAVATGDRSLGNLAWSRACEAFPDQSEYREARRTFEAPAK